MNTRCGAGAVGAIVLAGSLVGCGNMVQTEITGMAGVVLDAQGRRVRTLFEGDAAAGTHAAAWDLREERSRKPSGACMATINATPPDPGAPTAPWSADRPLSLREAHRAVIDVSSTTAQRATTPVEVSDAAYEKLAEGDVLVRQGEVWTRAQFDDRACRPDTWPTVSAS